MDKTAVEIRDEVLASVQHLLVARALAESAYSGALDHGALSKAIGIAVGEIEINILMLIYKFYPDLDDLKIKGIL